MRRRRFLEIATTVSVVGIAGCSGGSENEDSGEDTETDASGDSSEDTETEETGDSSGSTQSGDPQSSSIAVAGAYFTAENAEAASELVHPESDIEPNPAEFSEDFEVEFLDGEIIAEDVDSQYLEAEELTLSDITESVLESVRESEEVHLVEATLEYQSDGDTGEGTQTLLCATDDGDWYVLDKPAQTA